ncbi:MAG: succinyl-diaminopimelate desuccinylase [Gammaproteobacteria bacterium]|nr:succinyl-diaminopimelate desuccinylase [Gammaproteobacteria bacterium]
MTSPTLALARALIERPSVTPEDAGCLDLIGARLAALGFRLDYLPRNGVNNLWARLGDAAPLFVFAGHTDVVPSGPRESWSSDPFTPTCRDGRLYGRGAADMKGSIAAMVTALERFVPQAHARRGSIALLLTSDEEGAAIDGTRYVMQHLAATGQHIDWCLIGEPSSEHQLGDTLRHGRRGSLNGRLTLRGRQGHIAHPHKALNPIHALAPALAELCAQRWDEGSADFPPTSFQVSNIHAGTGAENVIPGTIEVWFNFRFSTAVTEAELRRRVEQTLAARSLDFSIAWHVSGAPFLTRRGPLLDATLAAVRCHTGLEPALSTGGGTSDGRFIAPAGAEVVELGPLNGSIHQIDEHVAIADLDTLSRIYEDLLVRLLPAF